ncbi:ribonuclease Oy-like [Homarus americanus]|uniref:Ribonuclease Oy-like n=1 Tax=Homarus americanus TaxID=6706 RepID=A0A8J5TKP0_HOMAM|nr:ribonuclease Oy-like [Homarus americanus]KAG7177106.1 Ribonuclease Oy-like [Homarus americanus]
MKLVLTLALVRALLVHARSSWIVGWDVLIFTQQWPITSCISHLEQSSKATCNLYPNMTSWTIHGIWPTKLGTIGPNYCNKSWSFEEAQIIDMEPYLIKYWGNIYGGETRTSLWKHEWTKHGTCAAQLPSLNSEKKYFEKGLEWVTHYDYVAVLSKHNIFPDDVKTYSRNDIYIAIKDMFGVEPAINCIYNKKTKQHELSQIKLCFDQSLHLVDCDGIIGYNEEIIGNCPQLGITYPASVRTGGKEYSYSRKLAKF